MANEFDLQHHANKQLRSFAGRQIIRPPEWYGERHFEGGNVQQLCAVLGYSTGRVESTRCDNCRELTTTTTAKEPVFPECVCATRYASADPGAADTQFLMSGKCAACYLRGIACSNAQGRLGYDDVPGQQRPAPRREAPVTAPRRSTRKRPSSLTSPPPTTADLKSGARVVKVDNSEGLFTPGDKGGGSLSFGGSNPDSRFDLRMPPWSNNDERLAIARRLVEEGMRMYEDDSYVPSVPFRRLNIASPAVVVPSAGRDNVSARQEDTTPSKKGPSPIKKRRADGNESLDDGGLSGSQGTVSTVVQRSPYNPQGSFEERQQSFSQRQGRISDSSSIGASIRGGDQTRRSISISSMPSIRGLTGANQSHNSSPSSIQQSIEITPNRASPTEGRPSIRSPQGGARPPPLIEEIADSPSPNPQRQGSEPRRRGARYGSALP